MEFTRKTVAIVGSKLFAQPELVNAQMEATPKEWTVVSNDTRGPSRWAATRAASLDHQVVIVPIDWAMHGGCNCAASKAINPSFDDSYCHDAQYRNARELLELAECVIVFGDDPIITLARKRNIPVRVVHGHTISKDVADAETRMRVEQFAMREYRQDEAETRSGFEAFVQEDREAAPMTEALDAYDAEMLVEREKWDDGLHAPIRPRDRRLPNMFIDNVWSFGSHGRKEDWREISNIEDFSRDDLTIIDRACTMTFWRKVVDSCIEQERPITPRMFDAMCTALAKDHERWTKAA